MTINNIFLSYETNRFLVVMGLFSKKSPIMSKCVRASANHLAAPNVPLF